jgi:RNA polymerase sigma-70 factor (sigma-E family)
MNESQPLAGGALRRAFDEHYRSLVRLCGLLAGGPEEAEDIVQDAFVRAANHIERLDAREVGPYLRATVLNLWRNRARRLKLERSKGYATVSVPVETVPREDRTLLWSLVLTLPPRQRACLVLRYYEDLKEREVARLLGCTVGTVKSQTSRAIARLRRELRDADRG